MNKKLLQLLFAFAVSVASVTQATAQVSVTSTIGAANTYTTLGDAFTAINQASHKGIITVTLTGNTTETAAVILDSSGNGNSSSYTAITIKPQTGVSATISGTVAGNFITLSGADNVTFDGVSTSGVTTLTITNTSTNALATTIAFTNGATVNTIKNCTVGGYGSNANTAPRGIIYFGSGSLVTGNNDNTIQSCFINGFGAATNGICSSGSTTFGLQNAYNLISACQIFDCFTAAQTYSTGILLNTGNIYWQIQFNSIYQSSPRTVTAQGVHQGITIYPTYTVDAHIIKQNFIGGSGPNCTGTMTYTSSTVVAGYQGMSIQCGGSGTLIDSNYIQNISLTYASSLGSFQNVGIASFIGGYDGEQTISGNNISNLSFSNTAGSCLGSGITTNARVTAAEDTVTATYTIYKNTINNITYSAGGTGSVQYFGIRLECSSGASLTTATTISNPYFKVDSNIISNISTPVGGASGWIRGIGTALANGGSSTAVPSTLSSCPLWPRAKIKGNSIFGFTALSTVASYTSPSAVGILYSSSGNVNHTKDTTYLTFNKIYNLSGTNTTDIAQAVAGIYATAANYVINGNMVYGLSNASVGTTTTPIISGINVRSSFTMSNVANNYVTLGNATTTNTSIFGILNNFSITTPAGAGWNIYNNSVYISGNGTGTSRNTACFYRGNETFTTAILSPMDVRNNLFVNNRFNGTGVHFTQGSFGTGNWTGDYNALICSTATNVTYYNGAVNSFATWKTNTGADKYAEFIGSSGSSTLSAATPLVNITDLFNDASPATTGILDIKTSNAAAWIVAGKARAISFLNGDIKENSRSTTVGISTSIGAHQITTNTTPPDASESGTFANGNVTTYTAFGRQVGSINWINIGSVTARSVKFYSGVSPAANLQKYSNGYVNFSTTGSGFTGALSMNYDSSFIGSAGNTSNTRLSKAATTSYSLVASSSVNTTTMVASADAQTTFGNYALTDVTNPLPVTMGKFFVNLKGRDVVANWSTYAEQDNAGFTVERKLDGDNWIAAGFVKGNPFSNNYKAYSFTDANLNNGVYFYRLKQVNADGSYNYSEQQVVRIGSIKGYSISQNYPNPVKGATKIGYQLADDAQVMIELYNTTGQKVATLLNQKQVAGNYTFDVNTSGIGIHAGNYTYKVTMVNNKNVIVLQETKNMLVTE